jgi:hypothetical protein
MYDENDLIFSPLQRTLTEGHRWVKVCIYRMPDSQWTLEIEDDKGSSTVWDAPFVSDQAALELALAEIEAVGLVDFIEAPPSNRLH